MAATENVSHRRLVNQLIRYSPFDDPADLLRAMGAVQAQDFSMSLWAIGMRLNNATMKSMQEAFNDGLILRTHVLRPTWHMVAAEDIRWMLTLTAPRIRTNLKSRWKDLQLNEATFLESQRLIEKLLVGGNHLTREEIFAELGKTIAVVDQRGVHLMLRAELDGIICSGAMRDKKQTYALLEERVPPQARLSEEEALGKLTQRYFKSHGPATLHDFVWWSGLSASSAKKGLDIAGDALCREEFGSKRYWFSDQPSLPGAALLTPEVFLLPAYDEFLIAYSDRSASIDPTARKQAVSNNGIFRPVIVVNGVVSGIWKRTVRKNTVEIEPSFFSTPNQATKDRLEEQAVRYGGFLSLKAAVRW